MSKFISELANQKSKIGAGDFFIADNPEDGKTYKVDGSVFLSRVQLFSNKTEVLVEHNLSRNPLINVVDISGNLIEGEILYLDSETFKVEFNAPISGTITYW